VLAAIVAAIAPAVPIAAGVVLLVGCLGVLLGNVTAPGPVDLGNCIVVETTYQGHWPLVQWIDRVRAE